MHAGNPETHGKLFQGRGIFQEPRPTLTLENYSQKPCQRRYLLKMFFQNFPVFRRKSWPGMRVCKHCVVLLLGWLLHSFYFSRYASPLWAVPFGYTQTIRISMQLEALTLHNADRASPKLMATPL